MAVQAALFGLAPPPVETARILELGCGDGSNLIPMSLDLPNATLVGIDLAAEPIERGLRATRGLGIPNIDLIQADVRDLPDAVEHEFDYVIAHGLYSWIPPDARDAVMATCARLLAPEGVAFVSYNAYPGSHVRDTVREMVAYAVGDEDDPDRRVTAARSVLELLAGSGNPDPHAAALASFATQLLARPPWLLYHDELSPICDAFYLHQFLAHARSHGLHYLFESRLSHGMLRGLSATASEALGRLPDAVEVREQFLDFVVNRMFRESLLTRHDLGTARSIDPTTLSTMRVAGRLDGDDGTADDPAAAEIASRIRSAWPSSTSVSELMAVDPARPELAGALLDAHTHGQLELELRDVTVVGTSLRPDVGPWVRWQVQRDHAMVTNARHQDIRLEDANARRLVALLDGTRDVPSIARDMQVPETEVAAAIARLADLELLRA